MYHRWLIAFIVMLYLFGALTTQSYIAVFSKGIVPVFEDVTIFNELMVILGAGFLCGNFLFAYLARNIPLKGLFIVTTCIWSICALLYVVLPEVAVSNITVFVGGMVSGGALILTCVFIKNWMMHLEYGRTWGLFFIAIHLAFFITNLLVLWSDSITIWRYMSLSLFGLGVLVMLALLFFYEETPSSSKRISPEEKEDIIKERKQVLLDLAPTFIRPNLSFYKGSVFWTTAWALFSWGLMLFFGVSWFPGHEISVNNGIFTTDLMMLLNRFVLILGAVIGGIYTDKLFVRLKCLKLSRTNPVILSYGVGTLAGIFSLLIPYQGISITCVLIAFLFLGMAHAQTFTLALSTTTRYVGTRIAYLNSIFMLGLVFCPWFVVVLTEMFSPGFLGLLLLAISGGVSTIVITLFQRPSIES